MTPGQARAVRQAQGDRIVVTGAGVLGAGAHDRAGFARALAGPPPPAEVLEPGPPPLLVRRPGTGGTPPVPAREARRLSRPSLFAIAATREALGVLGEAVKEHGREIGVALGTGYGSVEATRLSLEALHERADFLSPAQFVASVRNEAQSAVARVLGLRGPSVAASNRRLSFEDALGWALLQLANGRARALVALGADEITPLLAQILQRYRLTGERPIWGEGAGALLLEREGDARAAGRRVLARVRAWTSGVGSPGEEAAAIGRALARDAVEPATIEVFLDEGEGSLRRGRERAALLDALAAGGVKPLRTLAVADHAGHMPGGGSLAAVAGVCAVSGEVPGLGARAALVSAREADGAFAAYVLEAGEGA